MRFALKRGPEELSLEIAGRAVPVAVRRNRRARRLILRLDSASGLPVLTLPLRASLGDGERFVERQRGWIETRLARRPAPLSFSDGVVFSLRGAPCRIRHRGGRGLVQLESAAHELVLSVPGEAAHLPRRVADWLKREARCDIATAVARHAAALGREPTRVRIGDAKSRWGSCSSSGALAFSWRLILAPPHVLDYLAAHEVAHLAEMNHGPDFWRIVAQLDPEHRKARAWLKAHGPALHAVGRG